MEKIDSEEKYWLNYLWVRVGSICAFQVGFKLCEWLFMGLD